MYLSSKYLLTAFTVTGAGLGAGLRSVPSRGFEVSGGDRKQGGAVQRDRYSTAGEDRYWRAQGRDTWLSFGARDVFNGEVHQAETQRTSRDDADKESEEEDQVQRCETMGSGYWNPEVFKWLKLSAGGLFNKR